MLTNTGFTKLMYRDFGTILFATLLGIILVAAPLIIQWLIAPSSRKTKEKLETYECGEEAEGSAWLQFNIRFYVIALIFLIFVYVFIVHVNFIIYKIYKI